MQRITLQLAMAAEAAPIVHALGLTRIDEPDTPGLPRVAYAGTRAGCALRLVHPGPEPDHHIDCVGTEAAALLADRELREHRPDLLLNAGTCGGFAHRHATIGTVYATGGPFHFHDRRVGLAGFADLANGGWTRYDAAPLCAALRLPTGPVSTGSSLDALDECLARIEASAAVAKDMEAAAIAWVSRLHDAPMLALKSVTDLVDRHADTPAQFNANLAHATQRLADETRRVLDWLIARPPRLNNTGA